MQSDNAIPLALECKQVTMKVRKKEILHEVSFSLEKGRIAGLLGPNGAGKSTLLSICSGLTEPTSGSVRIFGELSGAQTLRSIAVLPDRAKLPGWLTAGEWLEFAGQLYPDWDYEKEAQLVQSLRIDLGTRISAQSRGEEARLQLISCLARTSPLILLDEPFTGVDMISREQIASSVVADLADGMRTFLIATHDIREMEQLFDRIILLGNGRIAADHEVDNLREQGTSVESRYREVFS